MSAKDDLCALQQRLRLSDSDLDHPHVLTRSAATGLWRAASDTAVFVSNIVLPAAVCEGHS